MKGFIVVSVLLQVCITVRFMQSHFLEMNVNQLLFFLLVYMLVNTVLPYNKLFFDPCKRMYLGLHLR